QDSPADLSTRPGQQNVLDLHQFDPFFVWMPVAFVNGQELSVQSPRPNVSSAKRRASPLPARRLSKPPGPAEPVKSAKPFSAGSIIEDCQGNINDVLRQSLCAFAAFSSLPPRPLRKARSGNSQENLRTRSAQASVAEKTRL
ncbi:MAG: hypothetical protein QM844_05060, partial [Planctomycetota bacterium]|nr:hypothetical protein [Planctomycetota bacterium]